MPASRTGRRFALATTLTGLIAAPLAVVATAVPAHAANVTVQVIATNDFHGRLQLRGPENRDPDAGAAVLAGAVKQLEADNPSYKSVFAAAGDLIGASTFESFIQHDKPTIDALNEAGLDVSAAGNHEFDQGVDDLVNRVMAPESPSNPYGGAEWQYISANVRNVSDNAHTIPDRWMEDFGSVQVGFVGAVTEDLPALVSPAGIASIKVTNIIKEVNRSANALEDEGADVIVLLVHEGAPDVSYASATSNDNAFGRIVNGVNPNIDAIVSGHTHLAYNHSVPVPAWEGRAVTERPVVSAGQYGQNLNQLLFTVNDVTGQVTTKTQNLIALTTDADGSGPLLPQPNFPADPATTTIVSDAFAAAEGPGSVVLGQLAAPFKRAVLANGTTENRGGESTLSNLVAEVQRWATASPESGGAQIALMNAGGLRQNMVGAPGGYPANLTYKQAAVVQPFANTLVNMRLTGSQLKAVLEQQWQRDLAGTVPTRPFQRLGTSKGFRYTYDPARPEGDRITGMWLNGTRLASATSYSVTVNSFLASGGDNFRALRNGTSRRDTGKVDLQAMVDYLAANSPVAPDYTQHAVGVSFPAGAPADYLAGDRVKFNLSSLAFTAPEDARDASVKVSLGSTDLGTFPVDNTLGTDQFDEYGKAAVDVALPAGTAAGARELVVTGTTTGTVVTVPVTVRAVPGTTTPPPPPTAKVGTRIGKVNHKPHRVVAGETRARITFRVKAESGTPDGRVRVRVNGKVYKVRLDDGKATLKLVRFKKPGRYKITISYRGNDTFEAAKKVVKLRVRRS